MPQSQSCEWETPQWFFDRLNQEFGFELDPASTHENAKCAFHYTIQENGLLQPWHGKRVFLNPPYGRELQSWMEKAWNEVRHGATVVALIPVRSDTRWWHDIVMRAAEVRLVRGRLHFLTPTIDGGKKSDAAPFPSAVVVLNPEWVGPPRLGQVQGGKGAAA